MTLKFGIFDHMERRDDVSLGRQFDERLELLALADSLGFYGYHLAEHHQEPLSQAPSQSVFLAAAARHTKQLKLGALVYLLPFYHPLRLIEEVCMLDHLSHGRLQIGVGRGIAAIEHDFWGHGADEAQGRFNETLEILLQGLTNDVVTHHGEHFQFDRVPIELTTAQRPHPPFWYAGNVGHAGRFGMNFIGAGRPENGFALMQQYNEARAKSDLPPRHGPGEPVIGTSRHLFVADTDTEALAIARRSWAAYHGHYVRRGWTQGSGPSTSSAGGTMPIGGGPSLGGDFDLACRVEAIVAGSPETIRNYLGRFVGEGMPNYFVGAFQWGDLTHAEASHSLELFAAAAALAE